MSQESIYLLYYEALAFNNAILEIWITATFAVILSIYISSSHITRYLRWLVSSLYFLSAFVLSGRLLISIFQINYFRMLADSNGFEVLPGGLISVPVGIAYLVLVFLGSIATLYFSLTFTRPSVDAFDTGSESRDGDT